MSEEKWKSIGDNPFTNFLKDTKKNQKIFETSSAFVMALVINSAVQGFFSDDFKGKDLLQLANLFVAFASGFGIVAVQEDAMRKAKFNWESSDEMYKKYHTDSVAKAYKVRNGDFQRYFTQNVNDKEFKDAILITTSKKINKIKNEIFIKSNLLMVAKKQKSKNKIQKTIDILQAELVDLETNGINPQFVEFEMFKPSDIFAFSTDEERIGAQKVKDNSITKHRKKNLLARFYMPLISMLVTNGLLLLLSQSIGPVIVSSISYLLMLVWVWYNTYKTQFNLKSTETLPAEININTLLTDAVEEYKKFNDDKPDVEIIEDVIDDMTTNTDTHETVLEIEKG